MDNTITRQGILLQSSGDETMTATFVVVDHEKDSRVNRKVKDIFTVKKVE